LKLLDLTILGFTAWRVVAATVLLLLYAFLRIYWHKQEVRRQTAASAPDLAARNATPGTPKPRKWKEKPPVDLTDTQRIDHLHRYVSLKAGEQADLKDLTFGRLSKFCVAFAGVEHASGQDLAHIKIELGGATAACGNSVQEVGDNDFLVPRAAHGDQQHCSIHYTCGQKDAVSYLQVKVLQLDAAKQSASIDVLHVRGRRAA
jgi:hypothetical protein